MRTIPRIEDFFACCLGLSEYNVEFCGEDWVLPIYHPRSVVWFSHLESVHFESGAKKTSLHMLGRTCQNLKWEESDHGDLNQSVEGRRHQPAYSSTNVRLLSLAIQSSSTKCIPRSCKKPTANGFRSPKIAIPRRGVSCCQRSCRPAPLQRLAIR